MSPPVSTLPAPLTSLVGREKEIAAVVDLLTSGHGRLVTLTGPGGSGKTRLALAVLYALDGRFPDGSCFVPLASLADPGHVPLLVAQTLGLRELADLTPAETLAAYLRERRLLLCLDTFEHLLEAAPLVSDLLAVSPGLAVLATSRAPLRLSGEWEYAVPPLAPGEAVALFADRARAAKASFDVTDDRATVAEICERLDGLPLAIELAAARVRALPPAALLERLTRRLDLLTGGPRDAPARQRTLRATIDWSYGLLEEPEQALLARLSVFAGSGSLEAVETVCEGDFDALSSLVEKSLVVEREEEGEPRYALLETVREHAAEKLSGRGETDELRRGHAGFFLALAEEADPALRGPEQLRWLRRLEREHDDARAALRFALETGDAETGLRLGAALWHFWWMHGHLREGCDWLETLLSLFPGGSPQGRGWALIGLGVLWRERGEPARARAAHEQSRAIFDELGDSLGLAWALEHLGADESLVPDRERAVSLLERSLELFRELGDPLGVAAALNDLGNAIVGSAIMQGDALTTADFERAVRLYEENLALSEQAGNTWGICFALHNVGNTWVSAEEPRRALPYLHRSLSLFEALGDPVGCADSAAVLGEAMVLLGRPETGIRVAGAAVGYLESLGRTHPHQGGFLDKLRSVVDPERFERLFAEGRTLPLHRAIALATETLDALEAGEPTGEPAPGAAGSPGAPPPAIAPGSRIAGYLLDEVAGRGGMGVVWRARQTSLERVVAVKLLAPDLARAEGFRERFLREARLAASLDHPHVLPVHEAGEAEGVLFLAMRYVEGESLASLLAREERLAPRRAIALLSQIASALDCAHEQGLVHRDVKPENVLLARSAGEDHAYLCDFGLARPSSAETARLTKTGQLLGTVDYLAPEQIERGEVSPAGDTYALACLLFECLCGRTPFARENEVATLWAHVSQSPPSARDLAPGLPAPLDAVLARGLAKDPRERFPSAGELMRAAREALTPPSVPLAAAEPRGEA